MFSVFVYGTLTEEWRVTRMLGRDKMPEHYHAELPGFERLPNGGLFIVRRNPNSTVRAGDLEGAPDPLLLVNLTHTDMRIFDRYEGVGHGWYERDVAEAVWYDVEGVPSTADCIVYTAGNFAQEVLRQEHPVN